MRRSRRFAYGPDPLQHATLHLPRGRGPHRVAVLIHGGSWSARYRKWIVLGLAADLLRRGWAVWNVEYRAVGSGGGWPDTFADVGTGVDALADHADGLELGRVIVIGHSAGGQLALWAAGRRERGPGPAARIRFSAVVAQAGVAAMADASRPEPGGAVDAVMGGGADEHPDRYAAIDPVAQVPLGLPILLVHGPADETVSLRRSQTFAEAARAAGDGGTLVEIPGAAGGHRRHLDPGGPAWRAVTDWIG